jgi:glycosyltransferase involved in cell wall biosynthesis
MSTPTEPGSISAVVPTFNDVGRIGDALRSIAEQTLRPSEIVVADDASDDGTEQFVSEFASRHAGGVPVRYLRLPSRSGVVAARNEGIAIALGEWIADCDSDDVWAPTKLERQMEFIRNWNGARRIALLGTYGYNMNDAKKVISPANMGPTSEQDYDDLVATGGLFFVIHSSSIYLRSDFLALGGYTTEYGAADDFDFFCRMAELGVVINLTEPLVYYRKRAGSVQLARFWDQRQGVWRLAENQRRRTAGQPPIDREAFAAKLASEPAWRRFRRRMKVWGMYYYRRGATNMVNGRRVHAAGELVLAAVLDPQRLRSGVRNSLRAPRL